MITKDSSNMRCVGIFCDALFVVVFEDATIFCNNFKMITKDSIMRCVGFLVILDATIFCNKLTSPKRSVAVAVSVKVPPKEHGISGIALC